MKLKQFNFDVAYGNTGHLIKLSDSGVELGMNDFKPSPELIAMIEREAEAEINRRREATHV